MSSSSLHDKLLLWQIPGIGPATLARWLGHCDAGEIIQSQGRCLPEKEQKPKLLNLLSNWSYRSVDQELAWSQQPDCGIIEKGQPEYPSYLATIHQAPPLLYYWGDKKYIHKPQLAIVGSRNPSTQAKEITHQFAKVLSDKGLTVTSGLAYGIDKAAHQGAIEGSAGTIAVLGSGIASIYPQCHRKLAETISKHGAVISELPLHAPPRSAHFPRRNRIISGLSVGTLVMEATINSGSLITANYALEQGREVFAMPGSVHNPCSKGCHHLLRQGAKLVENVEDIMGELSYILPGVDLKDQLSRRLVKKSDPLAIDKTIIALLDYVDYESTAVDLIVARSGLTVEAVLSMILQLELAGYIVSVPGGYAKMLDS